MLRAIFFLFLLSPVLSFSQITGINPSQGVQGQTIPLIISGNNVSFSGWSCWSNTGNLSSFRFKQWTSTNVFYGTSTSANFQQLNGSIGIPIFQPIGIYDLEVYDCAGGGWVEFPNSFEVLPLFSSILNYKEAIDVSVSPNPSYGIINIQFISPNVQDIEIVICNSNGKDIFSNKLLDFKGKYMQKFDLSTKSKGVYLVKIISGGVIDSEKIILH